MKKETIKNEAAITVSAVTFSKNGVVFDSNISFEEWRAVGKKLDQRQRALSFWIGDWISFGRDKWEKGKYKEAEAEFTQKYGTLTNAVYVCQRIEPSRRRENLSFSHHREVAKFDIKEQDYYLDYAEKNHLSSRELRTYIKEKEIAEHPTSLSSEEDKLEKLWALKSHFKVPDDDDPVTSFQECLFFMSMLLERMKVIGFNLIKKEDQEFRKKYAESNLPWGYQMLSAIMTEINRSFENVPEKKAGSSTQPLTRSDL